MLVSYSVEELHTIICRIYTNITKIKAGSQSLAFYKECTIHKKPECDRITHGLDLTLMKKVVRTKQEFSLVSEIVTAFLQHRPVFMSFFTSHN